MNQANNNKRKISINIDIGDEIVPEGHLRIKDIKVLPEMQQRALVKDVEEIKKLPLDEQLDELTNDYYVKFYEKMLELSDPPPVTVYLVGEELILVDGFNRLLASKNAGRKTIPAIVMSGNGTKTEALRVSCRSNSFHNQNLSPTDQNCCVMNYYNTLSKEEKNDVLSSSLTQKKYFSGAQLAGLLYFRDNSKIKRFVEKMRNQEKIETTLNEENKDESYMRKWFYLWENARVPEYSHNTMNKTYSISELAKATCFDNEDELKRWIRTIQRKKQVIIYGPPGTGKTFLAKELAKHLTQCPDKGDRWDIVQFHPAYSYEDFMQGIRPEIGDQSSGDANGQIKYKWEDGIFLKFCEKAKSPPDNAYVLIIDEINRANLSSVFGELMYLLEYRGEKIKLAGNGKEFEIPENVLIIGTMNTADRSVSPIDNALRRRFAFLHLPPQLEILASHYQGTEFPITGLQEVLGDVNKKITDENFQLGVSFFLDLKPKDNRDKSKSKEDYIENIKDIWEMEIDPYLKDNSFIINDDIQNLKWDKISKKYDGFKTND
ncbi:MAG TPA: AAA family ATPase [Leptolyngbyaceae cyanobacterium]